MLPKLASMKEYNMKNEYFLGLPIEVISKIKEQLVILDEAYGSDRSSIENTGGYIQVIQSALEWNEFLEIEQIERELYEFVEHVNNEYIYMVYILSDDFSIGVIVPQSMVDIQLRD